jgi:hypothetical protein
MSTPCKCQCLLDLEKQVTNMKYQKSSKNSLKYECKIILITKKMVVNCKYKTTVEGLLVIQSDMTKYYMKEQ